MSTPKARANAVARLALALFTLIAVCAAALVDAQAAPTRRNDLDPSFVALAGPPWYPEENDSVVEDLVLLPDGKILVVGRDPTLVRLNPDGSEDASFNPNGDLYDWITDVDLLPNGQMYIAVARGFLRIGPEKDTVFRLNADGTRDTSFTAPPPDYDPDVDERDGTIPIEAMPDGRVYVKERFQGTPDSAPLYVWARLLSDGSLDTSFTVDGRYVAHVLFVDGQGRTYISDLVAADGSVESLPLARLLPDDTIDPSFNPPALGLQSIDVFPQPDGKLLVRGYTYPQSGGSETRLVRLLSDGSLDPSFSFTPIASQYQYGYEYGYGYESGSVTLLADGRFVFAGLRRFLPNGAPDASFQPFPISGVGLTVEQPDGKLVVAGSFLEAGLPIRRRVARLLADDSPAPSGPGVCVTKRYEGDEFYYSGGELGHRSRTFYDAGTTFTLGARSDNAVNAFIFAEETTITTIATPGSSYTAPAGGEYTLGLQSNTANTRGSWVEINVCGPGTTATPSAMPTTPTASPSASPPATATAATPTASPSASPPATATAATPTTSPTASPSATASPEPAPDNRLLLPLLQAP